MCKGCYKNRIKNLGLYFYLDERIWGYEQRGGHLHPAAGAPGKEVFFAASLSFLSSFQVPSSKIQISSHRTEIRIYCI